MALGERFEEVLAAARLGAEWAVTLLYRDLQPWILRYLRAQEPSEAEDLAAETWIDVAQGMERFKGVEADFRRWVFTIARRRLVDLRRRVGRRRTAPALPEVIAARSPRGDAEAEAMTNISTRMALARIASLPPDQAEVVLLRVLGGFDVSEVAEILGKRPGAIRVLQYRALQKLAKQMTAEAVTP